MQVAWCCHSGRDACMLLGWCQLAGSHVSHISAAPRPCFACSCRARSWPCHVPSCHWPPPAADWLRPEDSKPSAIAYDSSRRRLVW